MTERKIDYIEAMATFRHVVVPVNGKYNKEYIEHALIMLACKDFISGDKSPVDCIFEEHMRWTAEQAKGISSDSANVLIIKFKSDIDTLNHLLKKRGDAVPIPYCTIARLATTHANTAKGLRKNFKGEDAFYCDLAYCSLTKIAKVLENYDEKEEGSDNED